MPTVKSFTPEWLSRPSNGAQFFETNEASTAERSGRKTLAHRDSEVFVAAGNEIHWGDLNLIQAKFQDEYAVSGKGWRVLKSPVALPISELSVSPDGNLLAVITKHTCHVCVLPAVSLLRSGDNEVLRLKSFQLGPTAHVLELSPIVTCLWHPLSAPGSQSLVTITLDASVRLWELDVNNRYSFDQPGLAVSLVKLINAKSASADLSTTRFGANRGFSPDDVEMEVAAACFGGVGSDDEYGWASMTLWVAMAEGDIYALCPFLPSRFTLSSSVLPSLSTAAIAEQQMIDADSHASEAERQKILAQFEWLKSLDEQDALSLATNDEHLIDVYSRPERPSAVTKLQGPFQLDYDLAASTITDIMAIAPITDDEQLYDEDEYRQPAASQGLSLSILCIATSAGKVHICLPLDSVQGQWLPNKQSRAFALDDELESNDLLLFETALLTSGSDSLRLSFTRSLADRYRLLVTTDHGIYDFDFNPWIYDLEIELSSDGASGAAFRLRELLSAQPTLVESIITTTPQDTQQTISTAITILSANLGLMILTSSSAGPHAAVFSIPYDAEEGYDPEQLSLPAPELRETYQVSQTFYATSEFEKMLTTKRTNPIFQAESTGPLLAKTSTLQVFTDAHRILANETNRLGLAAADLFRRCERMRLELHDQIRKVDDLSQKVIAVAEVEPTDEEDENEDTTVDAKIDQRIMKVQSDAKNMNERLENLRRKMLRLGGEELSVKERAFVDEVEHLQQLTDDGTRQAPVDSSSIVDLPDEASPDVQKGLLASRLQHATSISQSMLAQVDVVTKREAPKRNATSSMNEYKMQKLDTVREMLERESALIEAVSERLSRLNAGHM